MSDKPLKDAGQESAAQQIAKILASVGGQRAPARGAVYTRACSIVATMPPCTCGAKSPFTHRLCDDVRDALGETRPEKVTHIGVDWARGERLVLTFGGKLSGEQREALRRQVREAFPDMPPAGVLVLDGGINLSVVRDKPKETPAPRFKVGDYVHYGKDASAIFRVANVAPDDPLPYRIERAINRDRAGTSWAWVPDAEIVPLCNAELIAHKLSPYGPGTFFQTDSYYRNGVGYPRCRHCDAITTAVQRLPVCTCDGARAHGEPVAP